MKRASGNAFMNRTPKTVPNKTAMVITAIAGQTSTMTVITCYIYGESGHVDNQSRCSSRSDEGIPRNAKAKHRSGAQPALVTD